MSVWNPKANAVFLQAVEMSSPDHRVAFLDEACAGDPALRAEVEQLLKAHEQAANFLQRPLLGDQQTQNMLGSTDGADPLDPPEPASDPISLDFLHPSDSPDSLGRLGQYEVREVVGRGGMGVVLKASDTKLNRIVAVKVLAPELASNAAARKRFVREARAAAAVSHDHVVRIYAVEDDPLPYLAMEFIDGVSLQEKIDRQGQLSLKEILRIGQQIAAGLAAAHGHGIIHRDIKPANILLENGVERVRITDFGLARAVDDVEITRPGEVAGTPQFMSPEQAQGQGVDSRSDLFSLGSVLYTMCTGRPPFRGDTTVAVMRRICDDTARPIREVNPDVPEWLVEIVERLLAKQPEDRFETAAEVAELLGRHLAYVQDPASTPFPGRLPPAERRCVGRARRPQFWLAAALILLTVVGGLGISEATGVTSLTATIIRIATGEGTLVIEVDDPTVQVALDGEELSITGAGIQELRLRPGRYQFQAIKDGEPVKAELVSITRGDRKVVRVTRLPPGRASRARSGNGHALAINSPWVDEGPDLAPDGLTLFFCSNRPGDAGDMDIWVATRPARDCAFEKARPISELNGTRHDGYPDISSDMLTLYFDRVLRIWVARRASVNDGWGEPEALAGYAGHQGPSVNADQTRIVTQAQGRRWDLFEGKAQTPGEFNAPEPIDELNSAYEDFHPELSPDGLTIYFGSSRPEDSRDTDLDMHLWVATRPTLNDPFAPPKLIKGLLRMTRRESGPGISPDGTELFYSDGRDLFVVPLGDVAPKPEQELKER